MKERIRLQAELRKLQATIEGIDCDSELQEVNDQCGVLRREIRRCQERSHQLSRAMRPRFTERGRA